MPDSLIHLIDHDNGLSLVLADTTLTAQEAEDRHFAGRIPAVVTAKVLTGAALLSSGLKDGERQSVQVTFAGPLRSVMAEADSDGNLRAYATPSAIPALDSGSSAAAAALGQSAQIAVIRSRGGSLLYSGTVNSERSQPRLCFQAFLQQSEQVEAVIELHAGYVRGAVSAATGALLRMLPGGNTSRLQELRARFDAGEVFEWLSARRSLLEVADELIPHSSRSGAAPMRRPLRFHCPCSRDRVAGMLAALGAGEIRTIATEDGGTEVNCGFCNSVYELTAEELLALADRVESDKTGE